MILTKEEIISRIWETNREKRQSLIDWFNSALPIEKDKINNLEVDDYWWKNYWFLTASKFKEFLKCKEVFYYKYLLLIPEPFKKPATHFFLWTCFDRLRTITLEEWMERWTEIFMEEYFVWIALTKKVYYDKLIAMWVPEVELIWKKVNELRELFEERDSRPRVPVNDWNKLMMMMMETEKNKEALDLYWWFENQKFFEWEYSWQNNEFETPISFAWTLDRYKHVDGHSIIRDWKTTSRIYNIMDSYTNEYLYSQLEKIIDDYGYLYQLWFYSILDRINSWCQTQDIYLDFISVNEPYNSIVMKIDNKKVLQIINTYIIPWLYEYERCLRTNDWESDSIQMSRNNYSLFKETSNWLIIDL